MSSTDALALDAAPTQRFGWLIAPLTAFLVTRGLIIAIVLLADVILPGFNGIHVYGDGAVGSGFVNAWDRWDTPYYVDIAQQGYGYVPGAPRNNVVFYPLYPLTIAALTPLTGNPLLAGLLISNASFLAALIVLYQLVMGKTGDEATARRAVFYIAAFPTAFFFFAAYTESLFLLLTVSAAYFALRQQWWAAGIAGALASATRTTGVLLVVLVGFAWLEAQGWTLSRIRERSAWEKLGQAVRTRWVTLIPILLIALGLALYMLYLGQTFGDPLAAIHAETGWRQASSLQSFLNDVQLLLTGRLWPSYIMDMAVFFIGMALTIPIGRRFGAGYALYTAFALLIPAATGVMAMTRFATVLFPLFILLASWTRRDRIDRVVRVAFLTFLPIFALAFVKNIFVG